MKQATGIGLMLALCLLTLGLGCPPDKGGGGSSSGGDKLTHIPQIEVELFGPEHITNGQTGTYEARVTYVNAGFSEDPPDIKSDLELSGDNSTLASASGLTVKIGDTVTRTFSVGCAPAGVKGTLGNSGHGSRTCTPITVNTCPPKCGQPGFLPCPPGCGEVLKGATCIDDGVSIGASFNRVHASNSDRPRTVLCIPSTGPTEGTKLP
jgi:hypothetical protein